MEAVSDVEEDFFTALIHLHSAADDSAEKLRAILDTLIAKKYGRSKTLAARRMCRDSVSAEARKCRKDQAIKQSRGQNELPKMHCQNFGETLGNGTFQTSYLQTHASTSTDIRATNNCGHEKMENVLIAFDRMEIPTISIPDEGSGTSDDALCKICNGPRLGPLILMECQECQDAYHPLCHQPPVLDLDIYDPRLVWHCAKCVELSEAAAIVAAATVAAAVPGFEDKKFHNENQRISKNETQFVTDGTKVCNDSKNHLNYFRSNKSRLDSHQESPISDQFQLRNRTSIGRRSVKRQTKTIVEKVFEDGTRNGSLLKSAKTLPPSSTSSSGLHLRKRVGSKLTMTRATAAASAAK